MIMTFKFHNKLKKKLTEFDTKPLQAEKKETISL